MLVGRIAGPLGVRGELKVQLDTDFPERFRRLESIFVGPSLEERVIAAARSRGDIVILTLRDIESREQAQALKGMQLWIRRADAMPLPPDQYYHDDIIGLRMETREGTLIGVVTDILVTGANDVYIVDGEDGQTLVPAIKDVVVEIDTSQGRIVIDPLPGLLE
jgi:16S rRNA processing protein RimM